MIIRFFNPCFVFILNFLFGYLSFNLVLADRMNIMDHLYSNIDLIVTKGDDGEALLLINECIPFFSVVNRELLLLGKNEL